jgi:hypothetical protein
MIRRDIRMRMFRRWDMRVHTETSTCLRHRRRGCHSQLLLFLNADRRSSHLSQSCQWVTNRIRCHREWSLIIPTSQVGRTANQRWKSRVGQGRPPHQLEPKVEYQLTEPDILFLRFQDGNELGATGELTSILFR